MDFVDDYTMASKINLPKIYGISTIFGNKFFKTQEELNSFIENHTLDSNASFMAEFIGRLYDTEDIIRLTYPSGKELYCIALDEELTWISDFKKYKGYITIEGNIKDLHEAFYNIGVDIVKDVYGIKNKTK